MICLKKYTGNSTIYKDPFIYNREVHITNGCYLIKIHGSAPKDEYKENHCPGNMEELAKLIQSGKNYTIPPEFKEPAKTNCGLCNGTGKVSHCPECEGDGTVSLGNDFNIYESECKTCHGTGNVRGEKEMCPDCEGTGEEHDYSNYCSYTTLNGITFSKEKIMKLRNLPLFAIDPHPDGDVLNFIFFGGAGILMRTSEEE